MKKIFVYILFFFVIVVVCGVFGIVHDQISYTVSPEYFTKFKFNQFNTPIALPDRINVSIVGWGASWWMGIPLGIFLLTPSLFYQNVGNQVRSSAKAIMLTFSIVSLSSLIGLTIGYLATRNFDLNGYSNWYIPDELHDPRQFIRAGWMHNASYLGAILAMIVVFVWQIVKVKASRKVKL